MYPDPTTFGFCNSEEKKKTKNERKGRGQRKKRRRKGSDHLLATHYWCLLLPSLSLSLSLSLARARAKKEREGEKKTFCFQKDGKKRESSQCRFMGRVGWPHLYCHGDVVNSFLVRCWLVCLVRVRVRLCVRLCLVCRIVLLHKVLLLLHLLLLLLLRGGVRVRVRP